MASRRGRPSAVEPAEVDVDIQVVDGEAGRRLAATQAAAILDLLAWLHENARVRTDSTAEDPEGMRQHGNGPGTQS